MDACWLSGKAFASNFIFHDDHAGLPSYRGLVASPTRRPKSDPLLAAMAPTKKVHIENEPGVHGGEYAVRPNMQESMVFLRKLFSHQQEGNQFPPTLLSPPDSPMSKSPLSVAFCRPSKDSSYLSSASIGGSESEIKICSKSRIHETTLRETSRHGRRGQIQSSTRRVRAQLRRAR